MLSYLRKYIYPREKIIELIPKNTNILDLGCGNGDLLHELIKNKKFNYYMGVDPKIKQNKQSINYNLSNLKIEDVINQIKKFDCVLMIDVMHHINKNSQDKLMSDIIKNLKAGSIFIYKDISIRNKFYSLMNYLHDLFYNFEFINYYISEKIIKLLTNENIYFEKFYIRILWYDHEFIIIKKNN